MKKTDIINPTAIKYPVASQGNKNTIPLNPTGTQKASIIGGFPDITMASIADGGIPPEGKDFNGLFYLATDYKAFLQNGGVITFNQVVSDLIGGYPQDAVLIYYKSDTNTFYHVISMIDDNTYNFVDNPAYIDGEKWKYAKTDAYMQGDNIFIDNKVISASGKYPYTFNNGNIDSNGEADLISYSGSDVTYKIGNTYPNLTGTLSDGQQFEVESITDDDVSALSDGDYIKFIGSDDTTDLLKNKVTVSKVAPTTPSDNDVWINNAVSPLAVKKYVQPNYTNNGVTITSDGIASGFSSVNTLFTNQAFDFSNFNSWEINIAFNINNFTSPMNLIYISESSKNTIISDITTSGKIRFLLWETPANSMVGNLFNYTASFTLSANTDYFVKLKFTGTNYQIGISTDGINFNWETAKTSTIKSSSNGAVEIGTIKNSNPFLGSIDLKEFKIYVDGNLAYTPNIPNGWVNYDKIPLGKITVESGAVSGVETYPFNIDYIGAGGAMPSVRFDELTVLASGGEYTAPSNGYFYFGGSESAYFQIGIKNSNLGMQSTGVSGYGAKVFCPIRKGEVITFRYNTAPTQARFIYAQDSRNEAI